MRLAKLNSGSDLEPHGRLQNCCGVLDGGGAVSRVKPLLPICDEKVYRVTLGQGRWRMAKSNYRPQLDGVRAILISFTVIAHTSGHPDFINVSVGVDVFFSLSGWLITWLLLEEQAKTGNISLRAFYIRRFFRIVPLYAVTFLAYVCAASAIYLLTRDPTKVDELRAAAPYLLTFNSEYRPQEAGVFFGHAWTVAIEEKFYLIWPAIMLFCRTWITALTLAVLISLFLIGCSFALMGTLNIAPLVRGYAGLGFGAALAMSAYFVPRTAELLSARWTQYLALFLLGLAYAVSLWIPNVTALNVFIAAWGAVLIGGLWLDDKSPLAVPLRFGPLVLVGRMSYGIYLIHVLGSNAAEMIVNKLNLPHQWWLLFVGSYTIAISGAWVLHRTIEKPMIAMGRKLAGRHSGPALVREVS